VQSVEAAVAADDDEAGDAASFDGVVGFLSAFGGEEGGAAGGSDDGAAVFDDVADGVGGELFHVVVDEAFVAAFDAVDGVAVVEGGSDGGSEGCVHAGGVAAAREYADGLGFDSLTTLLDWSWRG